MKRLKHKIKLFFARFRWARKYITNGERYIDRWKDYAEYEAMYKRLQEQYLINQRGNPTSKVVYHLEGKIEILKKLLDIK